MIGDKSMHKLLCIFVINKFPDLADGSQLCISCPTPGLNVVFYSHVTVKVGPKVADNICSIDSAVTNSQGSARAFGELLWGTNENKLCFLIIKFKLHLAHPVSDTLHTILHVCDVLQTVLWWETIIQLVVVCISMIIYAVRL